MLGHLGVRSGGIAPPFPGDGRGTLLGWNSKRSESGWDRRSVILEMCPVNGAAMSPFADDRSRKRQGIVLVCGGTAVSGKTSAERTEM